MKKTFFLVFSICSFLMYSQNDGNNFNSYMTDSYANIIPQTPNASGITQYGNTPVNNSSGLPTISIPIYTLSVDGVQVPISINYHASGVKVDDISSTVGLKWSINAGGGIFRTVKDLVDEGSSSGYGAWINNTTTSNFDQWLLDNNANNNYDYSDPQKQENIATDITNMDNWPDLYNYSFLNFSGDFIYKPDGSKIKGIEDNLNFSGGGGMTHLVYDLSGNEYFFTNDYEYNITTFISYVAGEENLNFSSENNIVGSMLSTIITKNSNAITFDYENYNDFEYETRPASQNLITTYNCGECYEQPLGCDGEGPSELRREKLHETFTINRSNNQLISKVDSDNVEIEFVYIDGDIILNSNTISIDGWDKRLDRIIIKDKLKNKQKEFKFLYNVFNGDKRLQLTEVYEIGFDGTQKPSYKFTYNDGSLPVAFNCTAKDYRGYYNGKDNNPSLLPKSEYTLNRFYYNGSPNVIKYPGYELLSDRYFNENTLSNGVLTKIEYPTGGSTEFTFEPNAYGENTLEPMIETAAIAISTGFPASSETNYEVFSTLVQFDNTVGRIKIQSTHDCPFCNEGDYRVPKVFIYEYSGNINDPINYSLIGAEVSSTAIHNEYLSRPTNNGVYIVQLKVHDDSVYNFINVNLDWHQKEAEINGDIVNQEYYYGGLRIKEVKDIDVDNEVYNHNKYTYLESDLNYFSIINTFDNVREIANRVTFSTDRIFDLEIHPTTGYCYTKVEIENQNSNTYGKTIEKYIPKKSFYNTSGGDMIESKLLNKDNDTIQVTSLEYTSTTENLTFKLPSVMDYPYYVFSCSIGSTWFFTPLAGYKNFNYNTHYYGRKRLLTSKKSTQFFDIGGTYKPVTTVTDYLYNDNLLVTHQELDTRKTRVVDPSDGSISYNVTNSNGEIIKTDFEYPDDYSLSLPEALPISKKVYNKIGNSELFILGQYFEYDSNGNIVASYKYNKGIGSHNGPSYIPSDYKKSVSFLTSAGKPTQIIAENGITTAYIWDSSKTYLLAEIINSTYANASSFISQNLNLTLPDITIANEINNIRQNLPDAQVTTYIYDPLIGVTQVIDPKGINYYYVYDDLGRLIYVKDKDEKIVSKNEYNYKN